VCPYAFHTSPDDTATNGGLFVEATYPVSDYRQTTEGVKSIGSSDTTCRPDGSPEGLWRDLRELNTFVRMGNDRVVGIVPGSDNDPDPNGYFDHYYRHCPLLTKLRGVGPRGGLVALVTEGVWTGVAHELGHTYYLGHDVISEPTPGYWFGLGDVDGAGCFMYASSEFDSLDQFIDKAHFGELFCKFALNPSGACLTSRLSPVRATTAMIDGPGNAGAGQSQMILAMAELTASGSGELLPWYFMPTGQPTESVSGGYRIRVLDGSGTVLSETARDVSFTLLLHPHGEMLLSRTLLSVVIPYPASAVRVEILRDDAVIASASPAAKLLSDAIQAIPDVGFDRNPAQRRHALLNKARAFTAMVESGDVTDARQKLQNDIRKSIESWVVDDFVTTRASQLSKREVLDLSDQIDVRLQAQLNAGQ